MTEINIKIKIGLFLVITHSLIIILIFTLYVLGGFLFSEMTTTIALIVPMYSIYLTAAIIYILSRRNPKTRSQIVSRERTFITFFIPSLFFLALIAVIVLKSFNIGFSSFGQFKVALATVEVAFGAYFGLVLSSLFKV